MNNSFHRFWYCPLWQQSILIILLLILGSIVSYYGYWQVQNQQQNGLNDANVQLHNDNLQYHEFFTQNPSLHQLEQQIQGDISSTDSPSDPHSFIVYLQHAVSRSRVILNQLQPIDIENSRYQLEIQGEFNNLIHLIQSLIIHPSLNHWRLSEVSLTQKNNALVATLSVSFFKEENHESP
ncbi:hypothetical protein GKR50_10735 [Providencia rustigianii]|uniref:hypothetical protein n=1 Tax=Providencia rustigianii TaxID=158850 RepID=UPI000F6D05D5|nr:hypothetical protein [Providencia rustigianii]MTC60492.1 hypothetical protein [Providencia rustigianii]VEH52851.1 Uncharacterised protein [Providencia rustigianii]